MLEAALHRMIPEEVDRFAKLEHGKPYNFHSWMKDRAGSACLYYWFIADDGAKKNKKRVPVSEIRAALQQLQSAGVLSRETFRRVCPTAESDGPCRSAVVGRILEALHVAVYKGRDGFTLTDATKADSLLAISPSTSEAR